MSRPLPHARPDTREITQWFHELREHGIDVPHYLRIVRHNGASWIDIDTLAENPHRNIAADSLDRLSSRR